MYLAQSLHTTRLRNLIHKSKIVDDLALQKAWGFTSDLATNKSKISGVCACVDLFVRLCVCMCVCVGVRVRVCVLYAYGRATYVCL
jgi:hypothetical protein